MAGLPLDAAQRHAVEFTIEELFTNMVKYAHNGAAEIALELANSGGGLQVTLIDAGVDRFDVTQAPDAAVDRPIGEREPGGLGLHLLRRVVDSLSYSYDAERREGRTCFVVGARASHADD
jgi:serine/threonine-protein kinase RsbW